MPSETADRSGELYIVEVDGVKNSEHRIFIEALKYGMELKRCLPRSEVKLRDAGENMPRNDTAAPKRIWGFGPVGKCAKSRQYNAKASPGVPLGRGSALKIRVESPAFSRASLFRGWRARLKRGQKQTAGTGLVRRFIWP